MIGEQDKPGLSALAGSAGYAVTLSMNGRTEEFPLASPQPQDFYEAKDFMIRDRTRKAIEDTAGILDPETRSKMIAEIRAKTQTHNSVLLDVDGLMYMHFLMARRAGFKGNWEGFKMSIQGADFRKLQDQLFELCEIRLDAKVEPSGKSQEKIPYPFATIEGTIAP
jgi:hypothetical protein